MTRVADAAHINYLDTSTNYKLCRCFRIVRKDGQVFGFTDHDQDLSISLGDGYGFTLYLADTIIGTSELQNKTNVGASNVDVSMVLLQQNSLDTEEVMLGLYDDAIIDIFEARWDITTPTTMRGFSGLLSEAEVVDDTINITYRSFAALYDQSILRVIKRGCSYELGLNTVGFHRCYVQMTAPEWTPSKAYGTRSKYDAKTEIGAICRPTVANKFWYVASTGGTSGTTEPVWPTGVGSTVVDGTVTWKAIRARSYQGTVVTVTDFANFVDASNAMVADYWRYGYLIWNTGNNAGRRVEIETDDGTGKIRLFERMKAAIQVGDTYTIYAGCDHFKPTCKDKFDNIYWFGGFDDAPGVLTLIQTPDVPDN